MENLNFDLAQRNSMYISRLGYLWIVFLFFSCSKKNIPSSKAALTGPFENILIDDVLRTTGPCEPSISIHPNNPKIMVAASVLDNVYFSKNGGLSWEYKRLSSTFGVYGDPVVRFGNQGEVYYGHLANSKGKAYRSEEFLDRIVVQKSEDFGKTWSNGSFPPCNHKKDHDKQWIAIDPATGHIAMTWTEFDKYGSQDTFDKSKLLFSISSDRGASWTEAKNISDDFGDCLDDDKTVEGGHPCFDLNGNIWAVWQYDENIYLDSSEDGGKTWGKDTVIARQPGGWSYSIPGLRRCNGFPTLKTDFSSGPYRGQMYIQWSAQSSEPSGTDVFVMVSKDQGKSWSTPLDVHGMGSPGHQFMSWMDVDPATGYIYIVYYDMPDVPGSGVNVYMSYSTDGGKSFQKIEISQEPFVLAPNVFFGDYNDISAVRGVIRPIWTRQDGDKLSVYTAIINHK